NRWTSAACSPATLCSSAWSTERSYSSGRDPSYSHNSFQRPSRIARSGKSPSKELLARSGGRRKISGGVRESSEFPRKTFGRATPSKLTSFGAGTSAIASSVGTRSIAENIEVLLTVPALDGSMRCGPHTTRGDRTPPSYKVPFVPRNGLADPAPSSGPLSEH